MKVLIKALENISATTEINTASTDNILKPPSTSSNIVNGSINNKNTHVKNDKRIFTRV